MKREFRTTTELRAESDFCITGYAALFNNESKDLGGFRETIAPGAFTRSLRENADVKCLFNHDPNKVLARTKSGTLTLAQDDRGLKFRAQLDQNSQMHRDIYASIKRADVNECSFAFRVAPNGQEWTNKTSGNDSYAARTLTDVDLVDVSAVCYPAYDNTSVDARSLFPDGEIAEIGSALSSLTAKRAADAGNSETEKLRDKLTEVWPF
jgi:HK97 family phage prohead protease